MLQVVGVEPIDRVRVEAEALRRPFKGRGHGPGNGAAGPVAAGTGRVGVDVDHQKGAQRLDGLERLPGRTGEGGLASHVGLDTALLEGGSGGTGGDGLDANLLGVIGRIDRHLVAGVGGRENRHGGDGKKKSAQSTHREPLRTRRTISALPVFASRLPAPEAVPAKNAGVNLEVSS